MHYTPDHNRYQEMEYRRSGHSGIKLPAISLGLWQNFGHINDFENSRKLIQTAFDSGITHFDLANNYGPPPGSAEENFGKILKTDFKGYRDEMIISSKAGAETNVLMKGLRDNMDNQNLNDYIKSVIYISFLTNKYINDEEPWKLKKTDVSQMNNILYLALEQIAKISILLNPLIPKTTLKVLDALNIKNNLRKNNFLDGKRIFDDEIKIKELNILFKKSI
jgi:hypothetical protein